jgi:hypothetical protein
MKKYTVKSTRKNPDKYIEKLKTEIAWRRNNADFFRDRWIKEHGREWIGKQDDILETDMSLEFAQQAKIGQKIVIHGIVSELTLLYDNKASAKFELDEVRLMEGK